jgi:hypothetical protein
MTMFDLALPRRVLFGPGRATELAGLLPGLGRRVLAGKAARSSSMQGNPVPLSEDELIAVLERS